MVETKIENRTVQALVGAVQNNGGRKKALHVRVGKTISFGNRGEKCNDVCIHIDCKRKYAYLYRETGGRIWAGVAKTSLQEAERVKNFEEADALYFGLLGLR